MRDCKSYKVHAIKTDPKDQDLQLIFQLPIYTKLKSMYPCTCTSTFIRQSLPFDCKDALLLVSTLPPRAGGGGGCLWREEFSFLRSANKLHSKDQQNLLLSSHKKTVLTEIDSEAFEIFSRYFTEANIHAQQQEPNKVLIIINNYYNNNNFIGWHNYWYFSSLHCGP